ncbi:nitroreductase A [compost metagenome]
MEAILHVDKYSDESYSAAMADYDARTQAYMASRSSSMVSATWTEGVYTKLVKPTRMHMKDYLDSQGFNQV